MADNSLPPAGAEAPAGESPDVPRATHSTAGAAQVESTSGQPEAKPEVKVEDKPNGSLEEQATEAAKYPPTPDTLQNVRLHFRVDPKTHEVTVLMVDKASRKVIRSIPPEELGKLQDGDLVELFA